MGPVQVFTKSGWGYLRLNKMEKCCRRVGQKYDGKLINMNALNLYACLVQPF